ncbi:hypothetical protein DC31_01060 [Microbacterium sp. CH12i]|uniref:hypothetical protein n=1 Tax=Microbacterium sp. CH12i TaxID=1479651 RepID=UPI0004611159|nr:hypothetical protein [Microbacterium sp. CH12i]KDA07216.1 hypothetical protein DC31_01060 [Microbacterium sp. CH12i]
MINSDAARQRDDFLARLDAEMQSVPHGIATEIRAGIAEELDGLDATATAGRIEQLGDPATIAQEAQAEVRTTDASSVHANSVHANKEPFSQSRVFAITAALVFAFGGFIVPVVGWFVGAVMVAVSARWRRWEKVLAITLPFATAVLLSVVMWLARFMSVDGVATERNPLLPTAFDLWHSGILLVFLLIPIIGGWLLWRLRRR